MTGANGHIATIPYNSTITRRAALSGLAVLAGPTAAAAACIQLEPADELIFAAIQRYRTAEAALNALGDDAPDEVGDPVCREHAAAIAALIALTPQTLPGLAAQLRCVQSFCDTSSAHLFDDWFAPLSGPSKTLLGRVAASLEGVLS